MKNEICLIIPCYYSLETLPRLLKSIDNQTYKNFDTYLAIDGDNYLEEYEKFKDVNIMYFDENQGAGMTRQRCLDKIQSKYKYVMFADSDDMLNPRAVEILHRAITSTNSDIAYSSIIRQFEDESSYVIDATKPEHRIISWCVGKMYNIKFLKKNKIRFRKELRLNEDIYFNFIAFNSTTKTVRVPEVTYLWMYNANSTTTKNRSLEYIMYEIQQSILASTYSLLDLAKNNKDKLDEELLAIKLVNIYTISQEALYYNIPLSLFEKEYKLLSDEIDVVNFVNNNPDYFVDRLYQTANTYDFKNYLYKESFIQFINNAYNNKKGGI